MCLNTTVKTVLQYASTLLCKPEAMRIIQQSDFDIVKTGRIYQVDTPVEISSLTKILERREADVYWLQPKNGNLEDQIAAVNINGKLYSMSLRLEKAVFRQFRLTRNFVNLETMQDGTRKLRIPNRLLREKIRTSYRHSVSSCVIVLLTVIEYYACVIFAR